MVQLTQAPATNELFAVPEKKGDPGCHVWIIGADGIPYIFERATITPPLKSGPVKHTNLSGGGPA